MNNEQVILKFLNREEGRTPKRKIVNGCYVYEGRTLESNGGTLTNYRTIIAEWRKDEIYLNMNKYSVTTSKIQSKIKFLASQKGLAIIECKGDELNIL